MQTAKTRVLPASEYFETHLTGTPEKEEARRKLLDIVGDYNEATAYEDLTDDEKKGIDALNLSEMLKDALVQGQSVDYKEVSFILGRLSALQKPELIPIVLKTSRRWISKLGKTLQKRNSIPFWIAIMFQHPSITAFGSFASFTIIATGTTQKTLLRVLRETHSDAVRRYAALALATSGTRSPSHPHTQVPGQGVVPSSHRHSPRHYDKKVQERVVK